VCTLQFDTMTNK